MLLEGRTALLQDVYWRFVTQLRVRITLKALILSEWLFHWCGILQDKSEQ
jgi:hypothetical protein